MAVLLLAEILTRLLAKLWGEKKLSIHMCTKDDGIKRPLRVRFEIQILVYIQPLSQIITHQTRSNQYPPF